MLSLIDMNWQDYFTLRPRDDWWEWFCAAKSKRALWNMTMRGDFMIWWLANASGGPFITGKHSVEFSDGCVARCQDMAYISPVYVSYCRASAEEARSFHRNGLVLSAARSAAKAAQDAGNASMYRHPYADELEYRDQAAWIRAHIQYKFEYQ